MFRKRPDRTPPPSPHASFIIMQKISHCQACMENNFLSCQWVTSVCHVRGGEGIGFDRALRPEGRESIGLITCQSQQTCTGSRGPGQLQPCANCAGEGESRSAALSLSLSGFGRGQSSGPRQHHLHTPLPVDPVESLFLFPSIW